MKKPHIVFALLWAAVLPAFSEPLPVKIDADKVLAEADRGALKGVNIAVYSPAEAFKQTMTDGLMADLESSLIRMPGGRVADKYYWNGNGVISDGKPDPSKFHAPYWQVDDSGYKPGFIVNEKDWSKIAAFDLPLDTKTIHEVTCSRPGRTNLVTINVGSGTPEMAAEWVRWANIKHKWNIKYWELGNELNGDWETGHIRPDGSKMTGEKYAALFKTYAKAMKAVDPSIKIGGPAADVDHHEDYFEPLLRDAGDAVDFLSMLFIMSTKEPLPGAVYLDNVGVLLRPVGESK